MVSDAIGTIAGAAPGTSTVTSFLESPAGVEQGGQSGLSGFVVAILFLASPFFSPLIRMVSSYPRTAAHPETIPAFLTLIGIPLSYSVADGLVLGFIRYPHIRLFSRSGREANWLTYVLAIVLVVYFGFARSKMG